MTKAEAIEVVAYIQTAYAQHFARAGAGRQEVMVDLWHKCFLAVPFQAVLDALMAYIATDTRGYPPMPGQINEQLRRKSLDAYPSEQEAWALVRKAVSNGRYGSESEYAALPEIVKNVLAAPSTLKDWADVDVDELSTVVYSQFVRMYRGKVERESERSLLPPPMRLGLPEGMGQLDKVRE